MFTFFCFSGACSGPTSGNIRKNFQNICLLELRNKNKTIVHLTLEYHLRLLLRKGANMRRHTKYYVQSHNGKYFKLEKIQSSSCVRNSQLFTTNCTCFVQKFPPNCRDPEYVPINADLMSMFLDGHNKLRNQHALGQTEGIFNGTTVADMATMVGPTRFHFIVISCYSLNTRTNLTLIIFFSTDLG